MANTYAGNHFATHFSPVMFVLLPIYALFPTAKTLLLLITAAICVSAIALFFFSRDRWGKPWPAALLGIAFLCHPVVHGMTLSGFQPLKIGIPIFILFFWQASKNRLASSMILLVLLLCCREDIAILTALTGLYLILFRRQTRLGLVVLIFSVAWLYITSSFVIAHFAGKPGSGGAYFDRLSIALFGMPLFDLIRDAIRDPLAVLFSMFDSTSKITYLPTMFLPLLLTPLLGISVLWIAAPTVVINLFSNYLGQHMPTTHYSAMLIAVTFVAMVVGLDRDWLTAKGRLPKVLALVVLACLVGIGMLWPTYAPNAACPKEFSWPRFSPGDLSTLSEIEKRVPQSASLASSRSLATHFAKRRKLLHILHSLEVLKKGNYDFILLDMQVPSFMPPVQANAMISYIRSHYKMLVGSGNSRIKLFGHQRLLSAPTP